MSRSYEKEYFAPIRNAEDRHFWFRSRNRVIAALARQLAEEFGPGYRFLEVGCGTGAVLRTLQDACCRGTVFGVDLFIEGLTLARSRTSSPLIQADAKAPPFRVRFEMIGIFDVLEHLEDDIDTLQRLIDLLVPNGALILTVPAHPWLWSEFDELSRHQRRYTQNELRQKLENTGFEVEYLGQYLMPLLPLAWIQRRLLSLFHSRPRAADGSIDLRKAAAQELHIIPFLNAALDLLLRSEAWWIARRKVLPAGTSLVAVARRRLK